ncbi:MAG: hypothetical protein V4731_12725 [Pseudomonadota bacterium]
MKTAVIYHYYELDLKYKENLIFFLSNAILPHIEYFFYISASCSAELPNLPNIKYIQIENRNHDFGGVLNFYKSGLHHGFDAYIFINSSVRGPFLPNYLSCNWDEILTSRLSKEIGMVGSSINLLPPSSSHTNSFRNSFGYAEPYIHVQTTAYALSLDAYQLIEAKGFFDFDKTLNKHELIDRYEILLSQILMNNNLSISSILPTYEKFSLGNRSINTNKTSVNGDPLYKGAFYGRTLSPFESLFVKTNRNMISNRDLASVTLTSLANKYNAGALTKDGIELFERSSNQLSEGEVIQIRKDQLISVLKHIKTSNPHFAETLIQILQTS